MNPHVRTLNSFKHLVIIVKNVKETFHISLKYSQPLLALSSPYRLNASGMEQMILLDQWPLILYTYGTHLYSNCYLVNV